MKNDFTFNDFLFFNDNDTDEWEEQKPAGITKPANIEFLILNAAFNNRNKWMNSPDLNVIHNILSYSKALSVIKTKESGIFHVLIN